MKCLTVTPTKYNVAVFAARVTQVVSAKEMTATSE